MFITLIALITLYCGKLGVTFVGNFIAFVGIITGVGNFITQVITSRNCYYTILGPTGIDC